MVDKKAPKQIRGDRVGETDLRDDKWHHIASVYLGGEYDDIRAKIRLYVDGRLKDLSGHITNPIQSVVDDSERVVIGGVFWSVVRPVDFLGQYRRSLFVRRGFEPFYTPHLTSLKILNACTIASVRFIPRQNCSSGDRQVFK